MTGDLDPEQLPTAMTQTRKANRRSKLAVGTTNISIAAIASA
jgi:hypothetical protein